jgi:ribonuclease P protein component
MSTGVLKPSKKLRFTFTGDERLKRKKVIETLFEKGSSFHVASLKTYHIETSLPSKFPAQILIGASKRQLKKAVDRNRAKRLLREAYRKNKDDLYSALKKEQKQAAIAFIYQDNKLQNYFEVEACVKESLKRLVAFYESR